MSNSAKVTHRTASALLLLFWAGHTTGTLRGRSPAPEADTVLQAMRTVQFSFNGADRTFYDLFFGQALMLSVYLLGCALVAWTLAAVEDEHWPAVAPIAWGLAAAQGVSAVVAAIYFFAGPALLSGAAAAMLVVGNRRAVVRRRSRG